MKVLHLPSTVTNLTIKNQPYLTEFSIPSYNNISTLWLENVSSAVDAPAILGAIPAGSRVRLTGLAIEAEDADAITSLFDLLDTMRGLDERGSNMDRAQVSGSIHTSELTGAQIASYNERYPYVTVNADHTTSCLYYYNYDGSELLYTETIEDGKNGGSYTGSPTRASTAQNTFTFIGWSLTPDSTSADANFAKRVTADRKVYAAYSITGKTYSVYFYNGKTLLYTVKNVPYGGSAAYQGDTPQSPDGSADEYPFLGWDPEPSDIHGNTSVYARFGSPLEIKEITDSWEDILYAVEDGSYKKKYRIGNYKPLDLGDEGVVNMQIVAKDKEELSDGSGKAPLSWLAMELLWTSHIMNKYVVVNYTYKELEGWYNYWAGSENPYYYLSPKVLKASETAVWTITFTAACNFKVSAPSHMVESAGSGFAGDYEYIIAVDNTVIYKDTGGVVSVPAGTVASITEGEPVTITVSFKQDSQATYSSYRYVDPDLTLTDDDGTGTSLYTVCGGKENAAVTCTKNMVMVIGSYQDGTGSIGGWEKSSLRKYMKETIKPLMPENVRAAIKEVNKAQYSCGTDAREYLQTTADDVWIPSTIEVYGEDALYKEVFQNSNEQRIRKKDGEAASWWTREAVSIYYYDCINYNGRNSSSDCTRKLSILLGFCT